MKTNIIRFLRFALILEPIQVFLWEHYVVSAGPVWEQSLKNRVFLMLCGCLERIISWKSDKHLRKMRSYAWGRLLLLKSNPPVKIETNSRQLQTNSSNQSDTIWNIRECSGCACWLDTASGSRHPCSISPPLPSSDLMSRTGFVCSEKYSQYWTVSCTLRHIFPLLEWPVPWRNVHLNCQNSHYN